MSRIREDADKIIAEALRAALPDTAVAKALEGREFGPGRLVMVAVGKAAWQMASTACAILGDKIDEGLVVTKYGHSKGELPHTRIIEAGHPVPDENSFASADAAIKLVENLTADDTVLFLLSGGGSALFDKPLIPAAELEDITKQLLACGANIVEMNTLRKHLSAVKGGRFAQYCAPAKVFSVVLSDIIGDPLDMIASGPAYPDSSTCEQAQAIVKRYNLKLSPEAMAFLSQETPKSLDNVETQITGSVRPARDAGSFLGAIARTHKDTEKSLAYIAGGETVVHLTGHGLGGRNQEIALAAAPLLDGVKDAAVFSVGSDGTDGPTDAAGGYCDGETMAALRAKGIDVTAVLADNDAYHALKECNGLIITGPTGTNVNDLTVLLLRR